MTASKVSVMPHVLLTSEMLVSSTVPEDDYAVYDSGATYALGGRCISTVTHLIYESGVAGNIGNDPTDINNQLGVTPKWKVVSPTNRWKMFDDSSSSQTVHASPLTVVLKPGFFNALYLDNLDAEYIEVTQKDATGGNVIFHYSGALENSAPADWYEHFFAPFRPQRDYIVSGLDPYYNAEVTVTLTSPGDTVKCGIFAVGDLQPLGSTLRGIKVDPKSFSYIKQDEFGDNTIVRRKKAKDMVVSAVLDLTEADYVMDLLTELQDVPTLVVASESNNHRSARGFGLVKPSMVYDQVNTCTLNVNVNGMT